MTITAETIAELSRRLALSHLRLQLAVAELKTETSRLALRYNGERTDKTLAELVADHKRNEAELVECQKRLSTALAQAEGDRHA